MATPRKPKKPEFKFDTANLSTEMLTAMRNAITAELDKRRAAEMARNVPQPLPLGKALIVTNAMSLHRRHAHSAEFSVCAHPVCRSARK